MSKLFKEKTSKSRITTTIKAPFMIPDIEINISNNIKDKEADEQEKVNEHITNQEIQPSTKVYNLKEMINNSNKLDITQEIIIPAVQNQIIKLDTTNITQYYYCIICLMEYEFKSMITLQSCKHMLCKECIIQYIDNLITIGKYNIKCPLENCKINLNEDELKLLISSEKYMNFIKWREIQKIENDLNLRICPGKNCGKIIYIIHETNYGVCECGLKFCLKCGELIHPDKTCEEIIAIILQNSNQNEQIKLCPKCNSKSIKDDGCNQVECSRCNYIYCWKCLNEWNKDHTCPKFFSRLHWLIKLVIIILLPIECIFALIYIWIGTLLYIVFISIFLAIIFPIIIIISIDKNLQNFSKFWRVLAILIEIPLLPALLTGFIFINCFSCNIITNIINDINQYSDKVFLKCIPRILISREGTRRWLLFLYFCISIIGCTGFLFIFYGIIKIAEIEDN